MSSLAVGSPDPRFGINAQSVTLVDLLEWRARFQAERVAYTFLGEGEAERISLTWTDLHRKAQAIGRQLAALNATGKTVLLLYPSDIECVATFFGCLYAGAIDVPAYLEMARAAVEKHGRQGTLEIRDAFFLAPLALAMTRFARQG